MAGKTVSKYTVLNYNSQVVGGVHSIKGAGQNYPEVDLSDLASAEKFIGQGIPECKITVTGPLDNTATTGAYNVFTAGAVYGSQVGAPLLIDYGILVAPATGCPRLSNTLMSVAEFKIDTSGPNSAPQYTAVLVSSPASVFSWTTKP